MDMKDGLRGRTLWPVTDEQIAHIAGLELSMWPCVRGGWNRNRPNCYGTVPVRGWSFMSTGMKVAHQCCWECGGAYRAILKDDLDPIFDLMLRDRRPGMACERCGNTAGGEVHHWAPRAIFGWQDAETWPKSFLCTACHDQWHRMMSRRPGTE